MVKNRKIGSTDNIMLNLGQNNQFPRYRLVQHPLSMFQNINTKFWCSKLGLMNNLGLFLWMITNCSYQNDKKLLTFCLKLIKNNGWLLDALKLGPKIRWRTLRNANQEKIIYPLLYHCWMDSWFRKGPIFGTIKKHVHRCFNF